MKGQTLGAFIKLLIFAVVTVLLTALLVVVIQNRSFGATYTYKAYFTDATGLDSGDQVKIAGVRVGTVKSVTAIDTDGGSTKAIVDFAVDENVPVSDTTKLNIRYLNLVGQRYLAMIETAGSGAPQNRSQIIPDSRTAPSLDLTALFDGFKPLFQALTPKDVNSFALEIVKTLQGEGGTIQDLVSRSATLTNTVANRDAVIGQTIDDLLKVLDNVQAHNADLSQLISQLQQFVTSLADNRSAIAASLNGINSLTSEGAGFIKKVRPYLTPDIKSLGQVANNLDTTKTCKGYFDQPGLGSNKQLHNELKTKKNRYTSSNCNGPNTLTEFLQREPTKLGQLIRTGSYGAFFNFYACDLNLANASTVALTFTSSACGD